MRLRSIILAISHRICCWLISISSSPSGVVVVYLPMRSFGMEHMPVVYIWISHSCWCCCCVRSSKVFFFANSPISQPTQQSSQKSRSSILYQSTQFYFHELFQNEFSAAPLLLWALFFIASDITAFSVQLNSVLTERRVFGDIEISSRSDKALCILSMSLIKVFSTEAFFRLFNKIERNKTKKPP